jgi:Zn-finger nucleic acid-binding protein
LPISEQLDFWRVKLQLFECPGCRTLWVVRSEIQGHQDWDEQCRRVGSRSEFDAMIRAAEIEKEQQLEAAKQAYEKSGKTWRW